MRLTLWLLALGSPSLTLTAQAQTDAASCKAAWNAELNTVTTPHHAYSTQTVSGQNHVTELIAINDKNYVLYQGHWTASPLSVAAMRKQEQENIDSAKVYICHAIRDEAVAGQATTVYSVKTENDVTKSDGQVWVAKAAGVIMRVEEDVDTGDPSGKMHISVKYDYANVKAPPGV